MWLCRDNKISVGPLKKKSGKKPIHGHVNGGNIKLGDLIAFLTIWVKPSHEIFVKSSKGLRKQNVNKNSLEDKIPLWEILIPQICTDLHDWENCTCTRKLLLSLFQTSKNNKLYIKQNLQIYWI